MQQLELSVLHLQYPFVFKSKTVAVKYVDLTIYCDTYYVLDKEWSHDHDLVIMHEGAKDEFDILANHRPELVRIV